MTLTNMSCHENHQRNNVSYKLNPIIPQNTLFDNDLWKPKALRRYQIIYVQILPRNKNNEMVWTVE